VFLKFIFFCELGEECHYSVPALPLLFNIWNTSVYRTKFRNQYHKMCLCEMSISDAHHYGQWPGSKCIWEI